MTTIENRKKQWAIATTGTKSISFMVTDAGMVYPNDRYTVIFDAPLNNGGNRGTTYPYVSMNSLGMGYHGEVDPAYVEAAMRGDITGERRICWDDLNKDCQATVRAEIRTYLEFQLGMAS